MENQQTDTDAPSGITVGTGGTDRKISSIYDAQPNWATDGYGIRGPQRPVESERVGPTPMEFGDGGQRSQPQTLSGEGACAPTVPPGSGTWVWGVVGGVCQWIDTTTCP